MKILLVEDDKSIAMGLEYSLQQEGYETILCYDIQSDRQVILTDIGFAILDLILPDGHGYELCREIKAKYDIPVLFLSACDEEVNVVMGLDMGADDYITKPFRIRELLSRIRTVLRRYDKSKSNQNIFHLGNVTINITEGKIHKNGKEIMLTALEYRLLLTFLVNIGQVLTRTQLLESIWDVAGDFVNDSTLTVYIKRLRDKLEDDSQNPQIIQTIRGLGYKIGD